MKFWEIFKIKAEENGFKNVGKPGDVNYVKGNTHIWQARDRFTGIPHLVTAQLIDGKYQNHKYVGMTDWQTVFTVFD